MLGGFQESFMANYFCRYCKFDRNQGPSLDKMGVQRTVDSYKCCVQTLDENVSAVKGLKFDSIFNSLSFYHVASPGLPPCIGHDLFEGIVAGDMALIVNYLIELKWFTCAQLNCRIDAWPYVGSDSLDKPAPFVAKAKKISGHAAQNWVFLRMFSLFVQCFVQDTENGVWQMYLTLKAIVEILCSKRITMSQVAVVKLYIEEYIHDRQCFFSDQTLKPKHHFLLHYPQLILAFGPVIHLWTMRIESKHSYFKRCARQLKNLKHLAKTLAQRHQLLQTYYTSGSLFQSRILVSDNAVPLHKNVYNELIQSILSEQDMLESNTLVSVQYTHKNVVYKLGNVVVISDVDDDDVTLLTGKIQLLLVKDENLQLVVEINKFVHVSSLGLYKQSPNSAAQYQCISASKLKCCIPVSVYTSNGCNFISLKTVQS